MFSERDLKNLISFISFKFPPIFPLLATLKFSLDKNIENSYTDGSRIVLGKDFIEEATNNVDRIFIIMHELCHNLFKHCLYPYSGTFKEKILRMYSEEMIVNYFANKFITNIFNKSISYTFMCPICDSISRMSVNVSKSKSFLIGCLRCHIEDKTSDDIYKILKEKYKDLDINEKYKFLLANDNKIDSNNSSNTEKVEYSVFNSILDDLESYGCITSDLKKRLKDLISIKYIDWRRALWEYLNQRGILGISTISPYRYNFKHHLFRNYRILVNSVEGKKCNVDNIVIVVDTSGSISEDIFVKFISEINNLLKYVKSGLYIECDCSIKHVSKIFYNSVPKKFVEGIGGGGTSFVPPFEYIIKNNIKPNLVIYFTDGIGEYPSTDLINSVKCDVLWIITDYNVNIPKNIGKVIYFNERSSI